MADKPVPGAAAFTGSTDEHIQSQAAILLATGVYLRGDTHSFHGLLGGIEQRAFSAIFEKNTEVLPPEQKEELQIPDVPRAYGRISAQITRGAIKSRFGIALNVADLVSEESHAVAEILPGLAAEFHAKPTLETTANLLATSMRHQHPLVRVAAASSYFHITSEPAAAIKVLADGTKEEDHLTRRVAATALARVSPDHPRLNELNSDSPKAYAAGTGKTTLIVHGTWAKNGDWFIPGKPGNFYDYLKGDIAQDVWTGPPFLWSGSWSDAARALAAEELSDWVKQNAGPGLNLFGHSHGANVAMLANHLGVSYGQLVLLSCPVHWDKYSPVFDPVQLSKRIISIRVKMDLVILADGGGQKFKDSRIEENILDIWFDHFATHDPERWQDPKYDLPNKVDHIHVAAAGGGPS